MRPNLGGFTKDFLLVMTFLDLPSLRIKRILKQVKIQSKGPPNLVQKGNEPHTKTTYIILLNILLGEI